MTPSQSALSALPEEGASIYRRAQDYLLKLDAEIERLDKVLARLQPPITGRVRVVWWKAGGKTQCGESSCACTLGEAGGAVAYI